MLNNALIFENMYDDGENIWFTGLDYNALFKMNKMDWSIELIGTVPGERFRQRRLYMSTVMCDKKLYFAPYFANEIAEYNTETKKFKKVLVKKPGKESVQFGENEKFFCSVTVSKKNIFYSVLLSGSTMLRHDNRAMPVF